MISLLKKTWLYSIRELWQMLFCVVLVGAAGTLLVFGLLTLDSTEQSYVLMGTILAYAILIMSSIFIGMSSCQNVFTMQISMGRTRKEFFISYLLVDLLRTAIVLLVILGMGFLEESILGGIYKGYSCEFNSLDVLIRSGALLAALFLLPVLKLFMGSLFMLFQVKVFWVMWIIMMGAGAFSGNISKRIPKTEGIPVFTGREGGFIGILFLLFIAALLCGISYLLIRKRAVRI